MKINFVQEDNDNSIEIYLTNKEIRMLYEEDKAIIRREKDFLKDGKFTYFYVGRDLKEK